MTYEEHLFLSKYLFNKTVEAKKKLNYILSTHELLDYEDMEERRKKFYEELAYILLKNLKIDLKNHPPF